MNYYDKQEIKNNEMCDSWWFALKIIILVSAVLYWRDGIMFSSTQGGQLPTAEDTSLILPADIYTEYEANVSAYCPCEKCCGKYADGITASGHKIVPGDKFVATPKDVQFGTMIDIPGYGCVPVLDRGGAIKGNKLDVYFPTHQEALGWGRKYIIVKRYSDTDFTDYTD